VGSSPIVSTRKLQFSAIALSRAFAAEQAAVPSACPPRLRPLGVAALWGTTGGMARLGPKVKEATGIVIGLAVFGVGSSAFGASKLQRSTGGTWLQAFLASVPIILAMTTPIAILLIVAGRDRGDRMPTEVWRERTSVSSDDSATYSLGRWYRVGTSAFFILMVLMAPFFLIAGWRDELSAGLFVTLWVVLLAVMFRWWWTSSPSRLSVESGQLRVVMVGGSERRVPVAEVSAIRWPEIGGYVALKAQGLTLQIPKQVHHLDDLVVRLRQQNPAIQFDGSWPPPRR
jgi:hypothetical protein